MSPRICRSAAALALALSLLGPQQARAQSAADSIRIARLAALGRLWGAVKYFHPALVSRPVDWDAALVAAIPRVRAARSPAEYAAAVDSMLAVLGDPATRVVRKPAPVKAAATVPVATRWTADSTFVLTVADPTDFTATMQRLSQAMPDFMRAERVVFDLRAHGVERESGYLDFIFANAGINGLLVTTPLATPGTRVRMYSGFPTQAGGTSGGYWSGFSVRAGAVIAPRPGNARQRRIGFVIDELSDVPPAALALQQAGLAVVVADGAVAEISSRQNVWTTTLADSVEVAVRVAEPVNAGGGTSLKPDTTVVPSAAGDAALDAALALVRAPARAPVAPAAAPAFTPPPERTYPEMRYPTLEYRLLGAFRFWTAIRYFYPYRSLMGEDWDRVLVESIPAFETAADSTAYALAVARLATRIHDSHAFVNSSVLRAYFGLAQPPVKLRYVQGQPVVTEVSPDSSVRAAGLRVGDVVLAIDGESVAARRARLEPYLASSTPQALDRVVAAYLLGGAVGSTATLRVRGADGEREVRLARSPGALANMRWTRAGPTWKILSGNIGYVDLEKLTVPQVDSMFDALRDTRAIIFDNRSYPQGTAWPIAPRLTNASGVAGARFQRPMPMSPDTGEQSTYAFVQMLPPTDKWRYLKPTVMLVDERTLSQAEHTGLFFEAANHTRFIGSPTMGANGDVTMVVLPGGITMGFTGHDVRHADGRQLQRVGLKPDVLVRPTIAGIRAGRDEVLERAVRYIQTGR